MSFAFWIGILFAAIGAFDLGTFAHDLFMIGIGFFLCAVFGLYYFLTIADMRKQRRETQ